MVSNCHWIAYVIKYVFTQILIVGVCLHTILRSFQTECTTLLNKIQPQCTILSLLNHNFRILLNLALIIVLSYTTLLFYDLLTYLTNVNFCVQIFCWHCDTKLLFNFLLNYTFINYGHVYGIQTCHILPGHNVRIY